MTGFTKHSEHDFAPLPSWEASLPTLTAEPWFKVSDKSLQLEGLCFDRDGNLYFVDVFGGTLFKLELPSMTLHEIYHAPDENPAAIKIHKDGRLFVCCLGDFVNGHIFAIQPDGSGRETIIEGHVADDMVFAADGSFYFTHFVGKSTEPTGGVFHVSADYKTITPILDNMAGPNGVALSVNGRRLWATETNANRLHMIELSQDGLRVAPYGTSVPYHFSGYHGPDSCCIDAGDNVYVAMYQQGRVMIFNRNGWPIGQVLIPGREKGQLMHVTHPMLVPGTDDLLITTNDGPDGDKGSWILRSKGFASAHTSFQFD
ncbi:SMP-30/gluconolactonase/LRE family protein [Novosphingobium profundi]|uniref:SMP-30/gluconolactonase/LRE family protein n=1 Tax=Novosphingobium profundi TaxID=1774954 RepID=UPI001BD96B50|nr:SMP-30/gluconolactonase/LRE family protein [Novosphingobium profundi]MBT0670235.1 SMP-30/gluconolactonase/LRE family protein [Novosphingobium profundi]